MGQPTSDRVNELWAPWRSAVETAFQKAVRQVKAFRSETPTAANATWKPLPDLGPAALHRLGVMIESMSDTEREELLRTVGHTALVFESTKDPDFMIQLARQVNVTMALRNSDEYVKALHNEPQEAAPASHAVPIGDLLTKLG
jgi:hypothetical protein